VKKKEKGNRALGKKKRGARKQNPKEKKEGLLKTKVFAESRGDGRIQNDALPE